MNTTVVLVDSNERAVAPIATALAGAGYAACVMFSYGEAQRRLQVSAPDALVVSVELGAHNGLQLAMQCSRSYPTTPVIVMGPASASLEHDALALGATAYMRDRSRQAPSSIGSTDSRRSTATLTVRRHPRATLTGSTGCTPPPRARPGVPRSTHVRRLHSAPDL